MRTTNQLAAEKILVAHQRKDIGGCLCGWGVDTGHLGQSHPAHLVDVLTAAGLIADTPAVDREALAKALRDCFGPPSENEWGELSEEARNDWREDADAILDSGILLDAAAVRHEHGERIAQAQESISMVPADSAWTRQDVRDICVRIARDLSPAPPTEG